MLSEKDKEAQKIKQIETGIRICNEGVQKAEKYERLKDNVDWKSFLEDLKVLAEKHDNEIRMAENMILDAPETGYLKFEMSGGEVSKQAFVSSRNDWVRFIERHQIQKAQCLLWIKEPESILAFAALCREKLPVLEKQLEEFNREPVSSGSNGAS